jgi:hypothetical protein
LRPRLGFKRERLLTIRIEFRVMLSKKNTRGEGTRIEVTRCGEFDAAGG